MSKRPFNVIDIEVFPNYFLMVSINIRDYLEVANKYKLDEANIYDKRDIIAKVPSRTFVISNSRNDLLELLGFINTPQFLGSFNGLDYDNLILSYIYHFYTDFKNTKDLNKKLYRVSKQIVNSQKLDVRDEFLKFLYSLKCKFQAVDVQKVFGLNKVLKSLKQTLVNVNWYSILDYEMPKPTEEEYTFYANKFKWFKEVVDSLDVWDRYVFPYHVEEIEEYCFNDVAGTCELIRVYIEDINLRFKASRRYQVNLLSSSKSNMADKIFAKRYCDISGMDMNQYFKMNTTEWKYIVVKDCIPNNIYFKDPILNKVLNYYKNAVAVNTKNDLEYSVTFNNVTFSLGTGGIHSIDNPGVFKEDDEFYYIDADVTSYYPFIVLNYKIHPSHMDSSSFITTTEKVVFDRVAAKGKGDVVEANSLKIVINSGVFGKLGYMYSKVYDRKAMVSVTVPGQLLLLMLAEDITSIGGHVISANTDGLVSKIPKKLIFQYFDVCKQWCEYTNFKLEYIFYEKYIRRDVNNYLCLKKGNKPIHKRIKAKGDFNKTLHLDDLTKGYNAPIVAKAVENYYILDIPVMETLQESKRIEEFLITTKPNSKFKIVGYSVINKKVVKRILSKNIRYFVSNVGETILKSVDTDIELKGTKLVAGYNLTVYNDAFPVNDFKEFDINYRYYYERASKIINIVNTGVTKGTKNKKKYIKQHLNNLKLF